MGTESQSELDNNQGSGNARGCLRAIVWLFLGAIILAGLAAGGYWLYTELTRSFGGVNTRVDVHQQRIDRLDEELASLAAGDPQQERDLSTLATAVTGVDNGVNTLESDLAVQAALLATVEAQLAEANSTARQALSAADLLAGELATQEGYLGANATAVGTVALNLNRLDNEIERLRATQEAIDAAELTQLQQTLSLFRTWELITRARLRLLENNIGLATEDIQTAQETLAFVTRTMPVAQGTMLEQVQARLALAQTALPDDPETALGDLENAWDALDRLLVVLILQADPEELAIPTETATAETPSTPTTTPVTTPPPTPTPES